MTDTNVKTSDLSDPSSGKSFLCNEPISQELRQAINMFSSTFMQEMLKSIPGNVVASPVGIYVLLSMIQQFAEEKTGKTLDKVLNSNTEDTFTECHKLVGNILERGEHGLNVEMALAAFCSNNLEVLLSLLNVNYYCETYTTTTLNKKEAHHAINKWVSVNHKENVTKIVFENPRKCSEGSAVLAVCSSLYFDAKWEKPFYVKKIGKRVFYKGPREKIRVPTLYFEAVCYAGVSDELEAKWVHLNVEQGSFSVMFVMPTRKHTLDNVIAQMNPTILSNFIQSSEQKFVKMSVPMFKLKTKAELKTMLCNLGLPDVILEESKYFYVPCKNMNLVAALQDIKIRICDKGVSTKSYKGKRLVTSPIEEKLNLPELEFIVEEPFLVFLVDRKNLVPLLVGRVNQPKSKIKRRCTIL